MDMGDTMDFPVLHIDTGHANVDELKRVERILATARRVAYCRENGHDMHDLMVAFAMNDALLPTGGPPTGVVCRNCGTTWALGPAQPAVLTELQDHVRMSELTMSECPNGFF